MNKATRIALSVTLLLSISACSKHHHTTKWFMHHPETLNKVLHKCESENATHLSKECAAAMHAKFGKSATRKYW
ncbi:EexN family lipoprotein [Acidithiobacillus ferriphilus]|uniref:EexN family lipoprotein n=1 Tax=Acidithiobacillus ferriphilus TaxID=1689834 RepID=UPI003AEF2A66